MVSVHSNCETAIIKYLNFGEEVAEDADLNKVVKITVPGDYVV